MKIPFKMICRFIQNACTESEKERILERMGNDNRFNTRVQLLKILLQLDKKQSLAVNTDEMWEKMRDRILQSRQNNHIPYHYRFGKHSSKPARFFLRPVPVILSVLVLAAGIPAIFFMDRFPLVTRNRTVVEYQTVKVEFGKRFSFRLSDGSEIIADAGSEIRYPAKFTDSRHVYLKGEAFFNVTYDPNFPFYVHANHALVKVMGTRFNVRAWNENPVVSVCVSQGKVTLQRTDSLSPDFVTLTEGKLSTLYPEGSPTPPVDVDVEQQLNWMKNEMHFRITEVKEILGQLERWFDIEFVIRSPGFMEKKLSVHIKENNLDEVLNVIAILTNTRIEKDGKTVVINDK